MPGLQRHLFAALNIILLIAVTALAAYALHLINTDSLPIPASLASLSIVLPSLAGVMTETVRATHALREKKMGKQPAYLSTYVPIFILTIIETVLVTLAGTHIAPVGDLRCGLETKWQRLFHEKSESRVRRIQDKFECCGLFSVKDRAWPFPDKQHGVLSCSTTFGRDKSCFGDWRKSEQQVAGILLVIPILVFFWQIFAIATPSNRNSWLDQLMQRRNLIGRYSGEGDPLLIEPAGHEPRRAISYQSGGENANQIVEDTDDVEQHGQEIRNAVHSLRRAATDDAREAAKKKRHQRKQSSGEPGVEQNVWQL